MNWPDRSAHIELAAWAVAKVRERGSITGYRHPLGFHHLLLPSCGAWKLRLHIWGSEPESSVGALPQIHNHAFRFSSLVLRGSVRHTPFSVHRGAPLGSSTSHRILKLASVGDLTSLVDTGGRMNIKPEPPQTYAVGEVYDFLEGIFHLSESVGRTPAMTFLISEKKPDVTSYVLSSESAPTVTWSKVWLSPECLDGFLKQANSRLAALRGPTFEIPR